MAYKLGERVSSRVGAGRARVAVAALALAGLGAGILAASASAEGCSNEQLRGQDGYALQLPDCRAYEQVSPVDKNFTDSLGEADVVQSSPSGDGVTFFSIAPFPGLLSATGPSVYLSARAGGEWSTQGLAPPANPPAPGGSEEGLTESLTEDLSNALILVEPGLEAALAPGRYSYLRDSATGTFRLLGPGVATFADAAAADSRILFESREQLRPEAAPGVVNLYEWADGQLSLAGILPSGMAPIGGSVAGPGGPALGRRGGATGKFYTQNAISVDGSRVFFSDAGTGRIYMREPQAARTIPISAGIEPAYWRAATADGSSVFYTEGEDLYRFDVASETREPLTSGAAGVLGTLGIATENGSYAYFVATGVLAGNANQNREEAEAGKANLYEWHDGGTVFIARLSMEGEYDEYDWRDFYRPGSGAVPAAGEKSSRVSPDGTTVLFASQAQLTSYDNAGQGELYLYDATNSRLLCVSCNPSGAPATSQAHLAGSLSTAVAPERNAFLTRNLSADGSRVFFQTQEALVPQDTNEQTDVYEWEREGTGSCEHTSPTFSASSGGCLYLISTGQSAQPSYFGDAGADGSDVFFFTRQQLVGQDRDENADVYDARVDGGIAAQNPPPQTSCTREVCLGRPGPSPVSGPPAATTFRAAGNLASRSVVKPKPKKVVARCRKGKKRSHGRCVKKVRHERKGKKSRAKKGSVRS